MDLGRRKNTIAIFLIINIFIANFITTFAVGEGLPTDDLANEVKKTNNENKQVNTDNNTNTQLPPQTQEEKTAYKNLWWNLIISLLN